MIHLIKQKAQIPMMITRKSPEKQMVPYQKILSVSNDPLNKRATRALISVQAFIHHVITA